MSEIPPEILKLIGAAVVANGIGFVVFIWKVARWTAKVEYDLAQFGEKLGFEKGCDLAPKLRAKRGLE